MVRRGVAILFVVVLSFSFMISTSMTDVMRTTEISGKPRMYEISYDSHAPFNITSNGDFETQGWPGNGSATNPYLIQNLNITTTTDTACIWVMNTTSHFIIWDCLFTSPILEYGYPLVICPITLTNVSNGMIESNYFVESQAAVSGYSLSNCSISDNILSVSFAGIHVTYSNSTVISNNTQGYESCIEGIRVDWCRNSTISFNEFKNITTVGMTVSRNYDVHIIENSFSASTSEFSYPYSGIQVWGEGLCTIQKNILSNFRHSGIDVSGLNCIVQNNNITSCQTGILVFTNGSSTITGNRINGSFRAIEMVQANNTKVHGNFIIGQSGIYDNGIVMYHGHDCDVYSNVITYVGFGIVLQGSIRFNVSSNSVTDGRYGFVFGLFSNWGLPNGPFSDCDIANNAFDRGGIYLPTEYYEDWEFDTIRFVGNTVHGDPIGLFTDLDDVTIDGDSFGQLLLVNCNGIMISGGDFHDISSDVIYDVYLETGDASAITLLNCTSCDLVNINFHNNTIGVNVQESVQCIFMEGVASNNSRTAISISNSEDIDIEYVDISNSLRGIDLSSSYNCDFSNCELRNNEAGVYLHNGFNSTLFHNTISQNTDGLYLVNSDGTEIWGNDVFSNNRGILLNSTSECLITQNNIHNNTGVGIILDSTSNRNEIFYNTFAYNTPNAICEGSSNHWDDQVDTGNWWSDYSGEGAYIIDENDQDNFPNTNEPTTSNGTTTSNSSWFTDPLLVGIVVVAVGIIGLVVLVAYRRRIVVVD